MGKFPYRGLYALYSVNNSLLSLTMDPQINILEIDSIQLQIRGKSLLSDIYIQCLTGKITALLGLNAAGKSSLMKIIMGLLNSESKSIRINHQSLTDASLAIQYLPQHYFVPGHLTVARFLKDYKIAEHALIADFPIFKDQIQYPVKRLSGGLRRLAEVYTLIKSPSKFTLLDEPFTHLMPIHKEKIKLLIQQESSKGFLITDHLYKDLLDCADRYYLLQNGKTWPVNKLEDLLKYGYLSHI